MTSKIIVFGSPSGENLKPALSKAAQINNSPAGPFDALFLLGDVLSSSTPGDVIDELVDGKLEVPALPTYFYIDADTTRMPAKIRKLIDSSRDGKICENLTCVGSSGVVETSNGVRIAAVGPSCSVFELEKLKVQKGIDILFTDHWPQHIEILSSSADKIDAVKKVEKNDKVSELALIFQPRYHFVPGPVFWEREPFKNEGYINVAGSGGERPTRFISLAPFANAIKQKWFYAFNLSIPFQPTVLPPNFTSNPYLEGSKRKATQDRTEKSEEERDWIYGNGDRAKRRHIGGDEGSLKYSRRERANARHPRPRSERKPVNPSTCFFCLSNPQLAQHFIVSIGEESYITTAKGPLPTPDSQNLDCPGHILIIPLSHSPTIASISDATSRKNTKAEMAKYRRNVAAMLAKYGYTAVAFEISRHTGIHFHIQVVPIPESKQSRAKTEFENAAKMNGYTVIEKDEEDDNKDSEIEEDFFKVYLGGNKILYVPLSPEVRFDLQFGRKVLATVLDLPERSDWKSCVQEEQDEIKDAEQFKTLFKAYDFTLQE
ncbi:CwfJ C-terminus 1-domain-containing protein-like protein [Lipomyces tetrasporus]|uniref:CwfJ C-terminus 1-domain-containing protein-like protein n=1 Tax=Lipomyces tetrasporus TaxID=54092 RepID=A0AAD7QXG8_9ASCO|nr:CwfJ C-terminus 1-domain-containing protein-like protein [Lipomyces tetrasporus]KAJ8103169.1 CwfJ C-terminus 1-domain-containing protein-like protein [Lipomyces tetrasporus]